MIQITEESFVSALRAAVAEKGEDYVYTNPDGREAGDDGEATCHYVHGDQPGCLVGNVLHRLGVPLSVLELHEGGAAYEVMGRIRESGQLDFDLGVRGAAEMAQNRQDAGYSWGYAMEAALGEL